MMIPQAPISTPPAAYMETVGKLIQQAKTLLESGEKLQSFAFVGNISTKEIMAVMIDTGSDEEKDRSAGDVRRAAMVLDADYIFSVMEVWSLRADKVPFMDSIIEKYGSIGESPFAVDTCSFMLETRRGVWASQPVIKPKGISKKKRTIGEVVFQFFTETNGRFSNLLPLKEGEDGPAVLH